MDERYQQQSGSGPSLAPPQQYSSQGTPLPYQGVPFTPAPPRPSRVGMFGRFMRLLLRRTLYTGTRVARSIWPYRLTIALILPLLALIAVLSVVLLWQNTATAGAAFSRAESIPPGIEVEKFLEGQRTYNGDQMWDAFSADLRAKLTDSGTSRDKIKEQVKNEQLAGHSYRNPKYIGGVSLRDGGAIYFYLIEVRSPLPERNGPMSYVFTVDNKGKIAVIE